MDTPRSVWTLLSLAQARRTNGCGYVMDTTMDKSPGLGQAFLICLGPLPQTIQKILRAKL